MRIVFMGSAGLSCPSLDALLASPGDRVVGVATQPDRPAGRGRKLRQNPVAARVPAGVELIAAEKINAAEPLAALGRLAPDLVVVVAYGQILKPPVLGIPPLGCVNVHASLLPKYRGAAPVQWAIANGDSVTGVTTMYMNEKMDGGDIILQEEVAISPSDTGGSLGGKLADAGAALLMETLRLVREGRAPRKPQDGALATLAPKLQKNDGRIDWNLPAAAIRNRVRAFNPWPCCWCEAPAGSGCVVRILRAEVEQAGASGAGPGGVVEWAGEGPLVATGDGAAVRLVEVQPEGKKPMSGKAFACGHRPLERIG